MTEADAWVAEVGAHASTVLSSREEEKKKKANCKTTTKKKAISVVSYSCRFISLSIQTHRSPLNCFIEQYIFQIEMQEEGGGSLATLRPQWMTVRAHCEGARQLKWQRGATPERVGCAWPPWKIQIGWPFVAARCRRTRAVCRSAGVAIHLLSASL